MQAGAPMVRLNFTEPLACCRPIRSAPIRLSRSRFHTVFSPSSFLLFPPSVARYLSHPPITSASFLLLGTLLVCRCHAAGLVKRHGTRHGEGRLTGALSACNSGNLRIETRQEALAHEQLARVTEHGKVSLIVFPARHAGGATASWRVERQPLTLSTLSCPCSRTSCCRRRGRCGCGMRLLLAGRLVSPARREGKGCSLEY